VIIRRLALHDLKVALKDRGSLVWLLVMPVVFMYFIGTITGGFSGPGGERKESLGVVVEGERGLVEDWLIERLGEEFLVRVYSADGQAVEPDHPPLEALSRRLHIPAGTSEQVLSGAAVKLRFEPSSGQLGGSFDAVRVRRAVYRSLGDLVLAGVDSDRLDHSALAAVAADDQAVTVRVERTVIHPLYKRFVKKSKKFAAHDETNECREGDRVVIVSTRPLSKRKRWRVREIVGRAT